jgi:glycosyltransferase involved in cell wall biosynthesis
VALVDWHWIGHHPTYFRRFAATLAGQGATVVPFLPHPEDFDDEANSDAGSMPRRNGILPPQPVLPSGSDRWIRWRIGRWSRQLLMFLLLRRQLKRWERHSGRAIDFVFFACIYDWEFDVVGPWIGSLLAKDWAGLYLQARLVHAGKLSAVARMFSCPRLRAVATLDGGIIPMLRKYIPARPVVTFPEVVDSRLPTADEPTANVARKLRAMAGGRPIVSLVGWLQRSKGIEYFTEIAGDPRLRDRFFFLGGELDRTGIPPDVVRTLLEVWHTAPNIHAHLARLHDGPELNAILVESAVVFAAYVDFPHSSNILAKAAMLGRPVIVSRGFMMGAAVERHRLGIVVPQGDVDAAVKAILQLTAACVDPPPSDAAERESLRREFCGQHDEARLVAAFTEVLAAGHFGARSDACFTSTGT